MSLRLSTITTRTGDDGSTGLADGTRLHKDAPRIVAIGEVDELNAHLGVLLSEDLPQTVRAVLAPVQHELFDLGGLLCMPGSAPAEMVGLARLDEAIGRCNAALPPLAEFILPGGSRAVALAHVCRTVCRRAERAVVSLADPSVTGDVLARRYLNRLSDLLFILARCIAREQGVPDVLWHHPRQR